MIYIGSLGRLIGIKCPASQAVSPEGRFSFSTTLEGRRKAQVRPVGRRTWSLQTSDATTPEQAATLMQFANGAWGPGPFVFVSADAQFTNILTPEASSCNEKSIASNYISQAGPWEIEPGVWAPNSYVNSTPDTITLPFGDRYNPCIPGMSVTVSAYLLGASSRIGIVFYDAADAFISSHYSASQGTSTSVARLATTVVVPWNAVRCAVVSSYTQRGASPALTWTSTVQPWSDGQGCLKAVVSEASRDLVLTGRDRTFSNLGFTVMEVG